MANQATFSRRGRDYGSRGSSKAWDVGNDHRWGNGFTSIGLGGESRGRLGSSGILPASKRGRTPNLEDDDTLS